MCRASFKSSSCTASRTDPRYTVSFSREIRQIDQAGDGELCPPRPDRLDKPFRFREWKPTDAVDPLRNDPCDRLRNEPSMDNIGAKRLVRRRIRNPDPGVAERRIPFVTSMSLSAKYAERLEPWVASPFA